MTVSSSTNRWGPYAGAGQFGPFIVGARFLADSHLVVIKTTVATSVEETLTLNVDYTVSGAGADGGGVVTLIVALTSSYTLTIQRSVPITQETDYTPGDSFPAASHEDALDKLTMIAQGLDQSIRGVLRVPETAADLPALPNAATRADRLLAFDSNGDPTTSAAPSGTAASVLSDLINTLNVVLGDALVGVKRAASGSVATTLHAWIERQALNVKDFGAVGDGTTDDSAAIQAAVTAAAGKPIYAPAGTYRLSSEVSYVTTSSNVFTPGLQIFGDGPGITIFDNRVASGFAFRCATNTLLKFQHTVKFKDLQITTTTSPATSGGISLRSCYNVSLDNVWIKGLTGDGVKVIMSAGDQDGCNMVSLYKTRIENCLGWGFNTAVTGAYNEFSFLSLDHTFIQACGTNSATVPPPSGGMRWKGQILGIRDSAVVICENVGLYIQGGSGLSNTAVIEGTAFENNKKKHLYCDGVESFTMRRSQLYSNDTYVAQNGVQFDGATYTVRSVDISGTVVRATSGNNAYTAFSISGGNAELSTCRVRDSVWANFEFAGQSRFSGWQFDKVSLDCDLVALTTTSTVFRPNQGVGRGNKTPLRLRGSIGGTPSTTGEWVALQVAAGGISISNAALANSTRYYCYLYDLAGVPTLELSTTVFVVDSATGYNVKTGDATRFYAGSVETDAGGLFKLTAGGWLNPLLVPQSQVGVFNRVWADGTNRLMIRANGITPTSDTDGTVVGTQT